MAGLHIHYAVSKRYVEKRNKEMTESFLEGTFAPDMVKDKKVSHYSGDRDTSNLLKYLEDKVQLKEYVKEHSLTTDYDRAYFLHLVTDYLFFTAFIDKDYLKGVTYQAFCKDLYYTYHVLNPYLIKHYSLNSVVLDSLTGEIKRAQKEKNTDGTEGISLVTPEQLDSFIENVSSIDLDDYFQKWK